MYSYNIRKIQYQKNLSFYLVYLLLFIIDILSAILNLNKKIRHCFNKLKYHIDNFNTQ